MKNPELRSVQGFVVARVRQPAETRVRQPADMNPALYGRFSVIIDLMYNLPHDVFSSLSRRMASGLFS